MKAALLTGPQTFEVREQGVPELQPDGVLVRVRNCGICGSDLHFYKGEFPARVDQPMGHEFSGEVAAVGEKVDGISEGQRVVVEPGVVCWECGFCRTGRYQLCPQCKGIGIHLPGALAEYVHVPAYTLHALPDGLDFEAAALTEPLAIAVHGLRRVGLSVGERVAIIGSGTIGLMALVAARTMGASDVFMIARYAHQAAAAHALGAGHVVEASDTAAQELTAAFGGRLPEVVVETVGGHADTLNQAVTLVQPGGRVSILGMFTAPVSLNATVAVLKEVLMLGGYAWGRPGSRSDFEVALEIVARQTEDLRRLITHRVALDDVGQGFATAADKSTGSIKVTVEVH